MSSRKLNVLFLCTANSARSIMAEALLNAMAPGRFVAYSAGSRPAGLINRFTIELLNRNRIAVESLRSKSWDEFAAAGSPAMDFVVTVCDNAAGEACPLWLGQPIRAHWGINDPAAAQGDIESKQRAFFRAYSEIQTRLSIFVSLPIEKLDRLSLQRKLDEIGQVDDARHEGARTGL